MTGQHELLQKPEVKIRFSAG